MKKWFAFVLLLITIAGSFIPCCEVDNCSADQAVTQQDIQNDSDRKEGTCSPFYSCQTCAGFTQLAKHVIVPELISEATVHYERWYTYRTTFFTASFWQPPRLM
jgi:hypothetical protein